MTNRDDIPFVFAGDPCARLSSRRSDTAWLQHALTSPATRFVPVCGEDNVLLAHDFAPLLLDSGTARPLLPQAHCSVLLGTCGEHPCFALGLPPATVLPAADTVLTSLRPQFTLLDHGTLALLGYARVMVHWHLHNRFCGKCGAVTASRSAGHELHCTRCGNILYPRVNPAIIVLVTHADRCLLGRQSDWPEKRYSTIAGFVEAGESPEATVRREVQEETNIRVASMHYTASQPWPYPASLMLGFRAQAENTDIRCNDAELTDARWFSRADIVMGIGNGSLLLPTQRSISYRLVQTWFEETGEYSLDRYQQAGGSKNH